MVANSQDEALLEISFIGIAFTSTVDCSIAIAGAEFECFVNGQQVNPDQTIDLMRGDQFKMGRLRCGARAYLAVAGGFALDKVLGSYSTLCVAQLGGFGGRALAKGDLLKLKNPHLSGQVRKYKWQKIEFKTTRVVKAIPGPEFELFQTESQKNVFSQSFKLSDQCDRMGFRLLGGGLKLRCNPAEMDSTGLIPGSLQVTPDGSSILAMKDAQTTGGYPRILVVDQHDLAVLAQLRPGESIRFFQKH
jgi:antagonist of KipI